MKKLTTGFLALALLAGTSFAFTTAKSNAANAAKKAPFTWYRTISDTNPNPDFSTTPNPDPSTFGCSSGSLLCAAQVDIATGLATGVTVMKNP